MQDLETKLSALRKTVASLKSTVIGFSGGTDSSLLLKTCLDVLGRENVLAVTFSSQIVPAQELDHAAQVAQTLGARHLIIESNELENPLFVENSPQRCYYCKKERYRRLLDLGAERSIDCVVDGSNYSDLQDYRPGYKALQELGIRAPLQEAGITKEEVREISFRLGLSTWCRPPQSCLASRIPYGHKITAAALKQVAEAERVLVEAGFSFCRVRHHGTVARVELTNRDLARLLNHPMIDDIVQRIKAAGFPYVTVDLEGYRTGSLNELLK